MGIVLCLESSYNGVLCGLVTAIAKMVVPLRAVVARAKTVYRSTSEGTGCVPYVSKYDPGCPENRRGGLKRK
jgi:hypothetical protein